MTLKQHKLTVTPEMLEAARQASDWVADLRDHEIEHIYLAMHQASIPTEATGDDVQALEAWSDIRDDPDAIIACGNRWKDVAAKMGCQLHGFNDGRGASFFTPDGNVIEIGPLFRASLEQSQKRERELVELLARTQRLACGDWCSETQHTPECREATAAITEARKSIDRVSNDQG